MQQKDLRTYQRRSVTRESGFHTCDDKTGGECIILRSQRFDTIENSVSFIFERNMIQLKELFGEDFGLLAFGGYVYTVVPTTVNFELSYHQGSENHHETFTFNNPLQMLDWTNIGFHREIRVDQSPVITNVRLVMTLHFSKSSPMDTASTDFISFDFDAVTKDEYEDDSLKTSFYQKTSMHIPYLYYLNTELPFDYYQNPKPELMNGQLVVLKSCNRCGRFLPINILRELSTLSFSLHCKKRAPCTHSTFRAYSIQNRYDKESAGLEGIKIEDNKVISYFGHQLECKACKKFFVNAPLNPQRNAQQFKEDGLRRRAIEVLVNTLLQTNLIHFEYEIRTKKQFAEYIWNKFGRKCFKCKKELTLSEMALDHTMPLAYLYRLDETATCLCSAHNSQKSDTFPVDYYSEAELVELTKITGLPTELIHSRDINQKVLDLLVENIVWFYDEFLAQSDYQKKRDGILTANKINDSLKRVIAGRVDLAEEYKKLTGHYPNTVTIM